MVARKIVIDTDNTMGKPFLWNDDGLAMLYAFGQGELDILGITTVFGNSSGKNVYKTTKKFLKAIGKDNIPIKEGANKKGDTDTDAAKFLSEIAASNPGEITLLALGPLTNLSGAYKDNRDFFKNLKEIIFMGGITDDWLELGRIKMRDANLKNDLAAALEVLNAECPVTAINCHICTQVPFRHKHLAQVREFWPKIFLEKLEIEFWVHKKVHHIDHIFIWDVLVPVYLTNPELFAKNEIIIKASTIEDIEYGRLQSSTSNGVNINMPTTILNRDEFYKIVISSWEAFHTHIIKNIGGYKNFKINSIKKGVMKGLFSIFIPILLRMMYEKKGDYFYEK
ncbi:MAG: Inosine/uridine-preferring nucleoside hydrolase [Promethearchaeota archaeon]|nr:MAG: Inosine/uridine-preferring nucleoside hydrolase [Candidatus Lokiarchaeota archaeon]